MTDDDILEETQEDFDIIAEISFDKKLQSLSEFIREGCNQSSTYDPSVNIMEFIEDNAPDILITTTGTINQLSVNISEDTSFLLGKVVHLNIQHPDPALFLTEKVEILPEKTSTVVDSVLYSMEEVELLPIPGNATIWKLRFAVDAKTFLEEYIIAS